jgi:hypothetical protein
VEVLDSFFGNVCELDLVFNFYKVCGLCVLVWRMRVREGENRKERVEGYMGDTFKGQSVGGEEEAEKGNMGTRKVRGVERIG